MGANYEGGVEPCAWVFFICRHSPAPSKIFGVGVCLFLFRPLTPTCLPA